MSQIDSQHFAALAADPGSSATIPYVRAEGKGTVSDPLRVAFLLRHSDMADPTSSAEAMSQTTGVGMVLFESLLKIQSLDGPVNSKLNQGLAIANEHAIKTGTYYSVAAGIAVQGRLIAVAQGHVKIWHLRDQEAFVMVEPTVMAISEQRPDAVVLTAALGTGFDAERIGVCDVQLAPHEYALLGIQTDLAGDWNSNAIRGSAGPSSLAETLTQLKAQMRPQPPLVAIIGA